MIWCRYYISRLRLIFYWLVDVETVKMRDFSETCDSYVERQGLNPACSSVVSHARLVFQAPSLLLYKTVYWRWLSAQFVSLVDSECCRPLISITHFSSSLSFTLLNVQCVPPACFYLHTFSLYCILPWSRSFSLALKSFYFIRLLQFVQTSWRANVPLNLNM